MNMAPPYTTDRELAQFLQDEEYAQHLQTTDTQPPHTTDAVDEMTQGFQSLDMQLLTDREIALHLATHGTMPDEDGGPGEDPNPRRRLPAEEFEEDEVVAESSAMAARRAEQQQTGPADCASCYATHPASDLLRASCGDTYCRDCLRRLFETSMTDETLFPPRCHYEPIPLDQARPFLGPELAGRFEHKSIELSTQNRTYCHDRDCLIFIPPSAIRNEVGTCPACRRTTCSMCKGREHRGDCPRDENLQALAETAQREGWRQCRCGRWIELTWGCNHMSCPCGHQFCIVCGARWGTCHCPPFVETRQNFGRRVDNENRQLDNALRDFRQAALPRGSYHPPPGDLARAQAAQDINQQQAIRANRHQPPVPDPHPARLRRGEQVEGPAPRHTHTDPARRPRCTHPLNWAKPFHGDATCTICHKSKVAASVGRCRHCGLVACYPCRRNRLR